MHMLGPQRDSKPRSLESKAEALSVRLWELLRVFPSLFTLLSEAFAATKQQWLQWMLRWCIVALDATCRLTLSIFHFISVDGFMTSFLPFRSTFGIFNLFDNEFKSYDQRGIRTPNLLNRSQTPYPLCYAARWGLSHFCFFCNEWLRWGVKWHTVLAIVSVCQSFSLLEIDICWAPV